MEEQLLLKRELLELGTDISLRLFFSLLSLQYNCLILILKVCSVGLSTFIVKISQSSTSIIFWLTKT